MLKWNGVNGQVSELAVCVKFEVCLPPNLQLTPTKADKVGLKSRGKVALEWGCVGWRGVLLGALGDFVKDVLEVVDRGLNYL